MSDKEAAARSCHPADQGKDIAMLAKLPVRGLLDDLLWIALI